MHLQATLVTKTYRLGKKSEGGVPEHEKGCGVFGEDTNVVEMGPTNFVSRNFAQLVGGRFNFHVLFPNVSVRPILDLRNELKKSGTSVLLAN